MPFLALLLAAFLLAAPVTAQPDTTGTRPGVHARFYPGGLWSSTAGFGIGAGLDVGPFFGTPTYLRLIAVPAQHRGTYTAAVAAGDPVTAARYLLVSGYYEVNGNQRFYGVGPATAPDARVAVERETVEAEVRLGLRLGQRLLLQPNVRLLRDAARNVREEDPDALSLLDEASRRNLYFVTGTGGPGAPDDVQIGVSYALDAAFDLRDRPLRPSRGLLVQGAARRYVGRTDTDPDFDTFSGSLYGFIPLGEERLLSLRALAMHARNRGATPIPFYRLPSLDDLLKPGFSRYRFFGHNLLLLGVQYDQPLLRLLGLIGVDGSVTLNAANVYDDLGAQFKAALAFDRELDAEQERYPLRPAAGLGLQIFSLTNNRVYLHVMVGLSPEGFGASSFRFVHDLHRLRPRLRCSTCRPSR